jgi:hypothetical protein
MTGTTDDHDGTRLRHARTCTWARPCVEPARHPVWRETRPGLIVHEHVCDAHLAGARRYGYRTDDPPIPPPDAGDGQRSVT